MEANDFIYFRCQVTITCLYSVCVTDNSFSVDVAIASNDNIACII